MRHAFAWRGIWLIQQHVCREPHRACSGTLLVRVSTTRSCFEQLKYFFLHAVKKGPSSLAQDAGEDKADFPNGSKKRLDKSTESSSAPAELKQGLVCPLGALWLCGRVQAAGLQEHSEAAAGFPFLQCSATALGKGSRVHGHSKNAARG